MSRYGRIHIGVEYSSTRIDDFDVLRQSQFDIDLSSTRGIGKADLKKIQSDHDQIGLLLSKYPDEMAEILDDVLAGRVQSAKRKAKSIGFEEDAFQEKSGGLIWWLILLVVIAILLYPAEA